MSVAVDGWHELDNSALATMWAEQFPGTPPPLAYERGPLRAIVGREPVDPAGDDVRWHVSVSSETRLASWDELVDAAHMLRPGVVFVVGIPPRSWWLNVHPYTLHLWESRDPMLVEQWRSERRGDRPS